MSLLSVQWGIRRVCVCDRARVPETGGGVGHGVHADWNVRGGRVPYLVAEKERYARCLDWCHLFEPEIF